MKGSAAFQKETQTDNETALGLFHRAIELDPANAPAWVGVGAALTDRYTFGWNGGLKELATAEAAYGKALEYDPRSIGARRGLIHLYWYRGRFEDCLKQGKLIAASGATGTEVTLARAEAYMFGGLSYRAVPLLRQVMAEEPANAAGPWFMTLAGDWAGQFQEGVDAGEKFLTAFGEDSEVHLHMASCFDEMGRSKEAEFHYRRGIDTEPNGRSGARLDFARFLRLQHRLDESEQMALDTIDLLEDKLQRSPDNCWLRAPLGSAYGLVGDVTRMREEEERVRHDCGDGALFDLGVYEAVLGNVTRYVELGRTHLRTGNAWPFCGWPSIALDREFEKIPAYKELAAEATINCKRLDALY